MKNFSIFIFSTKAILSLAKSADFSAKLDDLINVGNEVFLICNSEVGSTASDKIKYVKCAKFAEGMEEALRNSQEEQILICDISELNTALEFCRSQSEIPKDFDFIKPVEQSSFLGRFLDILLSKICSMNFKNLSSSIILCRRGALLELQEFFFNDERFYFELLCRAYGHGFRIGTGIKNESSKFTSGFPPFRIWIKYFFSLFRFWRLRNTVYFADYDERAFNSIIPLQRIWQRQRYKLVREMESYALSLRNSQEFSDDHSGLIVDVGCGSGPLILSRNDLIGIDMSIRKLRYLRNYHFKKELVLASCKDLPLGDAVVQMLFCCEVIEHVSGKNETIAELCRVIKNGGYMILTTPDYGQYMWPFIEKIYDTVMPGAYAGEHVSHFTLDELKKLCAENNMELIKYKIMFRSIIVALFVKKIKS